jgi:succinate dehydrogenase/fumarate reductase flavoprotein subunit
MKMMRYIGTDVLVIGSGGAGLTAATVAASEGALVWLVSKDPLAGGDTKIAEGHMTVVGSGSAADSPDELITNMRLQGDELSDPDIVRAFAEDSEAAYHWLRQVGMRPRLDSHGKPKILPIPLGGHTKARSVKHQQKGLEFSTVLRNSKCQSEMRIISFIENPKVIKKILKYLNLWDEERGSQLRKSSRDPPFKPEIPEEIVYVPIDDGWGQHENPDFTS